MQAVLTEQAGSPFPAQAASAARVKGKTYWIIPLAQSTNSLVSLAQSTKAAAEAAGAKAQIFDGKGSPATIAQGIESAIAAKAAGIILIVIDGSTVQHALDDAKAAGIPVINAYTGNPSAPLLNGVVGLATPDNAVKGKLQADYGMKITGCDTHALVIGLKASSPSLYALTKTQDEFRRVCPSSCTNTFVDIPTQDVQTKLLGLLQTSFQRDPKINVVLSHTDAYAPYIVQAEQALGRRIPIISENGDAISVGQTGGPLVADDLYPPPEVMGWYFFHAMVLATSGQSDVRVAIPLALLDKTNWGSDPAPFALQPRYKDYQSAFRKLWGIEGS